MVSAEEYLKNLNQKSVWVFTKQKVSNFHESIKATNFTNLQLPKIYNS